MYITSSFPLQACLLSYLIHHIWSWNFTVKLCGLSHSPASWWDMSWTWNLITVVLSQTKNKFYCLSKVHYTQNTSRSWEKGLYERLSLILPRNSLRSNFTKSVHSFEVQILQNMSEVPVLDFFEIASDKVTPARDVRSLKFLTPTLLWLNILDSAPTHFKVLDPDSCSNSKVNYLNFW